MTCQIFNEDCIDTLKRLKDNSVKLVLSSPPYDKLRAYNGFSFDIYNVVKEMFRIIEDGGTVVWNVSDATVNGSETGTSFKQALLFMDMGFKLHDTMIWDKKHVFGTCGNPPLRYAQAFEYIFVFVKGKIKTFNPLIEDCIQQGVVYSGITRRDRRSSKITDCLTIKRNIANKDTKIKNNIFTYPVGFNKTSKDKIAFKHPAIFPEQLAADMIISYSNEGDLIYDPFMGSGTTAKMALLNKRNVIGSEISKDYIDLINARLEPLHDQLFDTI